MIYLVCIIAYLVLLALVGAVKSRQVRNQEDFSVAGRTLSPWMMVCTMLAVWVGTGSILGNAEQAYQRGMAALILPAGTLLGMALLSLIASRARSVEASSVPEIIGRRFGQLARGLAVVSLVIAYMVIVSYQFNAGGAVLEVITGDRPAVRLDVGDAVSARQLRAGRVAFAGPRGWTGRTRITFAAAHGNAGSDRELHVDLRVVSAGEFHAARAKPSDTNSVLIRENRARRLRVDPAALLRETYIVRSLPDRGTLSLVEPILSARVATIIAALFIVAYAASAGLLSLAYADVVTGSVITLSLLIAFPVLWHRAGGGSGMEASYAAMGDRLHHMQFWGVYSPIQIVNFCLPTLLLVLGDANQYQRIFASRNARGARSAVTTMILVACAIELLIIACAWVAGSMTPDPENGRYILIYAARHYLPLPLGCLFMVTVVGIIVSTADSFLLIPSTTVIQDVYLNYVAPHTSPKRTVVLSRGMVVVFGSIAYLVSLAFAESTGFFQKALYAYTIYGASITPSLVAAILWKRATKAGAIASIFVGVTVSLAWDPMIRLTWGGADAARPAIAQLDAVLPAITSSVFCLVMVSLLTRPTDTGSLHEGQGIAPPSSPSPELQQDSH